MARVGEIDISDQLQSSNQPLSYGFHGTTQAATNFFDQEGGAYFGELEEALMQGVVSIRTDGERKPFYTARPPTLEIFPSWPMRSQHSPRQGRSQPTESTDSGSAHNPVSQLNSGSPVSRKDSSDQSAEQQRRRRQQQQQQRQGMMAKEASGSAAGPNHEPKTQEKRRLTGSATQKDGKALDSKTLRRLAQNREAAKKSRLKKKAYIQQLECSRIRLQELEQDLQRARSQGLFLGGGGPADRNISPGAALFNMEYGRWLEENHKHTSELREGLQAHLPDNDLGLIVDECLSHYDDFFQLKAMAAKSDVFHLISGMWKTPAERCFLWIGGFRPSELLKMLVPQLETVTDQQLARVCNLQQSSEQAEEALSQGLEQLYKSLAETVASGYLGEGNGVGNYMGHMAIALGKIANLEGFVRQADNLRQQTLRQLRRILTIRQAARIFVAIGEYYNRLRALSTLWASRPRDQNLIGDESACPTITEMQIVYQPIHNHL